MYQFHYEQALWLVPYSLLICQPVDGYMSLQVVKSSMELAFFVLGGVFVLMVCLALLAGYFDLPVPYLNPSYTHKEGKVTRTDQNGIQQHAPHPKPGLMGHTNTLVSDQPENDTAWQLWTGTHASGHYGMNGHNGVNYQHGPHMYSEPHYGYGHSAPVYSQPGGYGRGGIPYWATWRSPYPHQYPDAVGYQPYSQGLYLYSPHHPHHTTLPSAARSNNARKKRY